MGRGEVLTAGQCLVPCSGSMLKGLLTPARHSVRAYICQGCFMTRFAPRLLVLLAASSLAGCTMMGGEAKETLAVNDKPLSMKNIANDLDGNVRQAQLLRLAGKHDEAIQILS